MALEGRHVKLADGTTVSMPDTPENQEVYPQQAAQQEGLEFPVARMVPLFRLDVLRCKTPEMVHKEIWTCLLVQLDSQNDASISQEHEPFTTSIELYQCVAKHGRQLGGPSHARQSDNHFDDQNANRKPGQPTRQHTETCQPRRAKGREAPAKATSLVNDAP
jgi:hypothetical protein